MSLSTLRTIASDRMEPGATFAGEINSSEAWQVLEDEQNSILVDVRSDAEWVFVGFPDLSALGKDLVKVSWQLFPDMSLNNSFLEQITESGCNKDSALMFICRSGARSRDAAQMCAAHGYSNVFNVYDGFEGRQNQDGHRGVLEGWKAAGLPWVQS